MCVCVDILEKQRFVYLSGVRANQNSRLELVRVLEQQQQQISQDFPSSISQARRKERTKGEEKNYAGGQKTNTHTHTLCMCVCIYNLKLVVRDRVALDQKLYFIQDNCVNRTVGKLYWIG